MFHGLHRAHLEVRHHGVDAGRAERELRLRNHFAIRERRRRRTAASAICRVQRADGEAGRARLQQQSLRLAGIVAGGRREHVRALVEVGDVEAAADDGLPAAAEDCLHRAVLEVRRPGEAGARRRVDPVGAACVLAADDHRISHSVQLPGLEERGRGAVDVRLIREQRRGRVVERRLVELPTHPVIEREVRRDSPGVLHEQAAEPGRRPVFAEEIIGVLQRGRINDFASLHLRDSAGQQRVERTRIAEVVGVDARDVGRREHVRHRISGRDAEDVARQAQVAADPVPSSSDPATACRGSCRRSCRCGFRARR